MPANIESWVALLIQVPLVGVFIWYSLNLGKQAVESQKLFLEALDKRDVGFESRNQAVVSALNSLSDIVRVAGAATQAAATAAAVASAQVSAASQAQANILADIRNEQRASRKAVAK